MASEPRAASDLPINSAMATPKPHPKQKREIATCFLKGLDLLTPLARNSAGLTAPEIRQRLKFPRTSVLRMLGTLEQFGLIAQQENVWGTTERFHDWCNRESC